MNTSTSTESSEKATERTEELKLAEKVILFFDSGTIIENAPKIYSLIENQLQGQVSTQPQMDGKLEIHKNNQWPANFASVLNHIEQAYGSAIRILTY